jgi:ABC-2 type transport system ATP-binding protein
VLVEIAGDETYDLVRDTIAELSLGLVRVEPHRHRLEEVFNA